MVKSRDITLPTKVRLKAMVFPVVMYGCDSWTIKKAGHQRIYALNCGIGEDSWKPLGLKRDPTSPSQRRSVLNINWKDWCWSWNSNTLATWCEELTHLKRPWCWERLRAEGEGDDNGSDGWMASPTQWIWVWESLGIGDGQGGLACCSSWGHKKFDMTEQLNWTELSMVLTTRIRPNFPLSPSLPSGSFHKPLTLLHQRADRQKTTITQNYPSLSHGPQPCLTQWNYIL